jgi:hypothetical protein
LAIREIGLYGIIKNSTPWLLSIGLLASLVSFAGPAHAAEPEVNANGHDFWTEERITINAVTSLDVGGIDYLLVKDGERWTVRRPDSKRPIHVAENEEGVRLQMDGSVTMVYSKGCYQGNPQSRYTECSCVKGLKGETRTKDGYGMCTSAFKTVSLGPVTALSTVLATGLMGWTGSTSVVYKLDIDALKSAVVQSGLIKQANEDLYNDYQQRVASAADIQELSKVIEKFGRMKYDPDNVLPGLRHTLASQQERAKVAATELAERLARERAIEAERQARERAIEAERQAIAQASRQKEAEAERKHRQQAVVQFRKGLKEGDDTFCGPVIEIKSKLVRIAVRVQLTGFAAEQWLKLDEVYMPDQGCRNTNGRLAPQSY